MFSGKVAMIGGMDQFNILTEGSREEIRKEVYRLFEGFGRESGYIMAASDHSFTTPVENLTAFAEVAKNCSYWYISRTTLLSGRPNREIT